MGSNGHGRRQRKTGRAALEPARGDPLLEVAATRCATVLWVMTPNQISRRSFLITGSALLAAPLAQAEPTSTQLTAAQVVEQIRNHVGVPWRAETVDRILAGDPDTVVKGIAVTMMATLDVIERA
ncbi:MAG: hypothetical protein QOJ51_3757, partial [Acidobacteriaceae bacterium]|nr:hypothetical protein [Acidobacteriaceae bacterium]